MKRKCDKCGDKTLEQEYDNIYKNDMMRLADIIYNMKPKMAEKGGRMGRKKKKVYKVCLKSDIENIMREYLYLEQIPLPSNKMAGVLYSIQGIEWATEKITDYLMKDCEIEVEK